MLNPSPADEERRRAGQALGLAPQLVPLLCAALSSGYARYGRPGQRYERLGDLESACVQAGLSLPRPVLQVAHDLAVALDVDDLTAGSDLVVTTTISGPGILLSVSALELVAVRTGLYLPGKISITGAGAGASATAVVNTRASLGDRWVTCGCQVGFSQAVVRDEQGSPLGLWDTDPDRALQDAALAEAVTTALSPLLDGLWTPSHARNQEAP